MPNSNLSLKAVKQMCVDEIDDIDNSRDESSSETEEFVQTDSQVVCDVNFNIDIICSDETERKFMEIHGVSMPNQNSQKDYDSLDDCFYTVAKQQKFNDLIRKVVLERLYPRPEIGLCKKIKDVKYHETNSDKRFPQTGDRVSVMYTPASQRYIDHYDSQAFTGEVFFIDEANDNFFMWDVETSSLIDGQLSLMYRVQSFKREGCHYFGMSDCYSGYFSFV